MSSKYKVGDLVWLYDFFQRQAIGVVMEVRPSYYKSARSRLSCGFKTNVGYRIKWFDVGDMHGHEIVNHINGCLFCNHKKKKYHWTHELRILSRARM